MQKNVTSEVSKNFLIYLDLQGNPEFCVADVSALCLPLCVLFKSDAVKFIDKL